MPRQIIGPTVALFLIGQIPLAVAASGKNSEILVYSDVCIHADTGDLLGTRIVLLRFPEGDYVYFQLAEGVMLIPELTKAETREDGMRIRFRAPGPKNKLVTFDGQITDKKLTGTFEQEGWKNISGDAMFNLPRVDIGYVGFPLCK
jgi:hypothetical protein